MLRSVRFWTAALLLLLLICCLIGRALPQRSVPAENSGTAQSTAVTDISGQTAPSAAETAGSGSTAGQTETQTAVREPVSAAEPVLPDWKRQELTEKAQTLSASLSDFVGWLYMADSAIDYPVMQGRDNQYYLHHAPDGSYLKRGSLFLDWRCARGLTDGENIIYGHNMVSGMFGDIRAFRTQEEFDAHRCGWFVTPDTVRRIDFFVLAVTDAFDPLYTLPADSAEWRARLHETAEFEREMPLSDDDCLIALSTCTFGSTAYARALLTGRLCAPESQ